jgi:HKD family nuclease
MDLNKIRNEFNKAILLLIGDKRDDNKSFINNEEYNRRMEDLKPSKIKKKMQERL